MPDTQAAPSPTAPVTVPCVEADGLLAVAVRDGVVELPRAVLLRGPARELFERGARDPAGLSVEAAADYLLGRGAASPEEARRDARGFLGSLRAHRLLPGGELERSAEEPALPGVPPDPPAPAPASGTPPEIGARDLERLAREVIGRGHRLRFDAHGRSMRTSIPSGARIEAAPCALEDARLGDVGLYTAGDTRLVAHRVVGRRGPRRLMRGDTCARLDEVGAEQWIGRVVARVAPDGSSVRLDSGPRRALGVASAWLWRAGTWTVRIGLVEPLRRSFPGPSPLRAGMGLVLRVASGLLLRTERVASYLRRPLDVARAALMSSEEKDVGRRALYERRGVQEFTSLDENVRAGLTLIEEVLLARHVPDASELPAGSRALVLGCGPGRECLALARRGFEVTGVDREPGMLAQARELARAARLDIRYLEGEASEPIRGEGPSAADEPESFDYVVVFSGLYNMLLPRERRLDLLRSARRQLRPGGRVLLTFLSAYVDPRSGAGAPSPGLGAAINPEHQPGDEFLLNEAVHVFPRAADLAREATDADLVVESLERDQRAYDRAEGRVRGYAVLRREP